MSDIIRRTDPGHQQPPPRKDAISLLPDDWQDAARFFYGFHSDYLKGTSGIATRLRMWMTDPDVLLTLTEAKEAMRRLTKPARCAGFMYAGQLLAAMAEEVESVVKKRRERDRENEFKQRERQRAADAAPAATVADILRRVGNDPNA